MKSVLYRLVLCCVAVLASAAMAQQNTVSISGNSRSIYFSPYSHSSPTGAVTSYLTTYDGTTSRPQAPFSGEVRPRAIDPGNWEADYVTSTSAGWRDWGSFIIALPMSDSDSNGLPDIAQLNRAVNITGALGNLYIDGPYPTVDSFTANLSRASNQVSGTYTLTLRSDASTSSGTIQLFNIAGSASYTRSTGRINFSFAITDPLAGTRTVTGATNYSVPNANQITVPQFSVSGNGATYTFLSGFTLNRSGSRYFGPATLSDGIPETSWRDAIDWVIEINDPNDWDTNGVPDISDAIPIPPAITGQPQSSTVILNNNGSFSVSANGSMPLKYQWQFKGTNMAGRTSSTLTITNVQFADAGDYRAIVSNGGGSATSQVATLTVIYPAQITDQPVDTAVILGDQAQFNVAAIGTDPLYYHWRHEGTNLPNQIYPILSIPSARLSDAGAYSVQVSNAAGSVVSSTAYLTVLVPPNITSQPRSQSAKVGANVTLSVTCDGGSLHYQWTRNGTNVPTGSGPNLFLQNVQPASQGIFNVMVSNGAGSQLSSNATLYVGWPLTLTNFVANPAGGSHVDLIGLPNTNYIFQWSQNLSNWFPIVTNNSPTGLLRFTDLAGSTQRFYRAKVKSP